MLESISFFKRDKELPNDGTTTTVKLLRRFVIVTARQKGLHSFTVHGFNTDACTRPLDKGVERVELRKERGLQNG
jgi:hypothetical protein